MWDGPLALQGEDFGNHSLTHAIGANAAGRATGLVAGGRCRR